MWWSYYIVGATISISACVALWGSDFYKKSNLDSRISFSIFIVCLIMTFFMMAVDVKEMKYHIIGQKSELYK